jgi:hypothetical protein
MKYAILILDTEAARQLSKSEAEARYQDIIAWYEKRGAEGSLADGGAELQDASTARTVRASGVTDGPFIEAKEVVGGFSILEATTIDEAVEIARTWPGVDRGLVTIEVRPVVEH